MYYSFSKNGRLIKFDDNIVVVSESAVTGDFTLDENGYALLRALPDDPVLDGNVLRVGKSSIATYDKKPPNISNDSDWKININVNVLSTALKFVAKNTNYKPVLMGVCVTDTGGVIATDGFKLFAYNYNSYYDKYAVLSPELVSAINTDTTLHINNHSAWTSSGIYGRLLVGEYPSVSKLLNFTGTEYDVPKNLISLLDKAALTGGNVVNFSNNELSITTETAKFCADIELPIISSFYLEHLKIAAKSVLNGKINYKGELNPLMFFNDDIKVVILPCKE